MNIIIVGCGNVGHLHLKCYDKLKKSMDINIVGFVDINYIHLKKFESKYYELFGKENKPLCSQQLKDISNKIDISDSVIDICTPNDAHYPCAKEACALGAKNILIEKPLASTLSDAIKIEKLDANIAVAENYIYSHTTKMIKKIIQSNGFKPRFVSTDFSKDRRQDALNGRGCVKGKHPHLFNIEIPHQLAIVNYLFGEPEKINGAWTKSLPINNKTFRSHGQGGVHLSHKNDIVSYSFSCLNGYQQLHKRHRGIRIYCENGARIIGQYPLGGSDTSFNSVIILHNNGDGVKKYELKDDNMLETLSNILDCFDKGKTPLTNVAFGKKIVQIINSITNSKEHVLNE